MIITTQQVKYMTEEQKNMLRQSLEVQEGKYLLDAFSHFMKDSILQSLYCSIIDLKQEAEGEERVLSWCEQVERAYIGGDYWQVVITLKEITTLYRSYCRKKTRRVGTEQTLYWLRERISLLDEHNKEHKYSECVCGLWANARFGKDYTSPSQSIIKGFCTVPLYMKVEQEVKQKAYA